MKTLITFSRQQYFLHVQFQKHKKNEKALRTLYGYSTALLDLMVFLKKIAFKILSSFNFSYYPMIKITQHK